MTRLLCIAPGASMSTVDVFNGFVPALQGLGCEVKQYLLDGRISRSGAWLSYLWRRNGRKPEERPTHGDIVYWASEGALEMALRLQPDWVLVFSAMYFHPDVLTLLRRAGQRVAVLFSESPYDDEQQARIAHLAEVCFTNERYSVPFLRQFNPSTFYLPHAFDPARHHPLTPPDDTPRHDVVFVGTYFQERIELLSAVDWSGIDLGLYGETTPIPSRSRLRQYIRGGVVPNAAATDLYRAAKIGLNLYRESKGFGRRAPRIAHAESLNPRAYELAASGCFTLSSPRAEVAEMFGPLVPTFRDASELEALIRGWLDSERTRQETAAALPARVADATFTARARQMLDCLERAASRAA